MAKPPKYTVMKCIPIDYSVDWKIAEPFIVKALDVAGGLYSSDDILKELEAGTKILWAVVDEKIRCILVTEILQFPQKRCANIDICQGNGIFEWAEIVLKEVEAWAKDNGCQMMAIAGRPGMVKVLKDYKINYSLFTKDL